jgi:putative ABC transport system permease protein
MTLFQVNFREAFRSLWGSRQRSLLALIGIVIGIGSVIAMVSIGTIVQQEAIRQFKDMGIDIITIRKSFSENKKTEFNMDIIMRITEEKRNLLAVAPYLTSGTELNRGRQKINMEQMGVTASFFDLNKLQVRHGRAVSELDQNRYFCVVGNELADFLQKTGTSKGGFVLTE